MKLPDKKVRVLNKLTNCIPEQGLFLGVLNFSMSRVLRPCFAENLAATDPAIPPPTARTSYFSTASYSSVDYTGFAT